MRTYEIVLWVCLMILSAGEPKALADPGLFDTLPSDSPGRGVLRMSSTSFYSGIPVNSVLKNRYGVSESHIYSNVFEFELGVTDLFIVNGSLPYYQDRFKQGVNAGKKTGAGDVVLGLRISRQIPQNLLSGFSFGSRVRIPEQLGYGPEPLGFRTFSYGKPGYSIDTAAGFRLSRMNMNLSFSFINFPNAAGVDSVFAGDAFYNTGFGYLGNGSPDASGLARGLFQNQFNASVGFSVPVKPWAALLLEYRMTAFRGEPRRDPIRTLSPGIRIGTPDGLNLSAGIEYALSGPVPSSTILFRFRIPTLSYRGIRDMLTIHHAPEDVKARNATVAFADFIRTDLTYLYEDQLRTALLSTLDANGFIRVVPGDKVENAMVQRSLVPLKGNDAQLGVRLGANYLINTEIIEYRVDQAANVTVPLLIGFPETDFKLVCRTSLIDMVTGEKHSLGDISATVKKPRGVKFFPIGPSSDMVFLSEPERRNAEKELINQWVGQFTDAMIEKSSLFAWEPKQADIGAVESQSAPITPLP